VDKSHQMLTLNRGFETGEASGRQRAFDESKELGRKKGKELGLELGFYIGIIESLRETENWESHGESKRASEIALVKERISRPGVLASIQSIEELMQHLEGIESLSEDEFDILLKVRAKFKVLESRIGFVMDLMPEENQIETSMNKGLELF